MFQKTFMEQVYKKACKPSDLLWQWDKIEERLTRTIVLPPRLLTFIPQGNDFVDLRRYP